MKYDEFSIAYDLAHQEGWGTGLYDHRAITDTSGFFSLKVDGEIVAVIACVKYGLSYSHLGLYICKREHRGKGYAYRLWKFAMNTVGGRNVGLDANMLQIKRFLVLIYKVLKSYNIITKQLLHYVRNKCFILSNRFRYEKSGFKSYYTHDRYNGTVFHTSVEILKVSKFVLALYLSIHLIVLTRS